jgi:hypothetical protein
MPRFRALARTLFPLALLLSAAACEASPSDGSSSSPRPSQTRTTATDASSAYVYEGFGVEAALTVSGSAAELEVSNATGGPLDPPVVWVLLATDGDRVELAVKETSPLASDTEGVFEVDVSSLGEAEIGMVFLGFGDDGYGAFEPVGLAS